MNISEEKEKIRKEPFSAELEKLSEDERRMFFSAGTVLLILAFIISHLYTKNLLWRFLGTDKPLQELNSTLNKEKVYNVLVEQDFKDKSVKDQIKALSDSDAAGTGGLTEKEGFHSLSPFYEFLMGSKGSAASVPNETASKNKKDDDVYEVGIYKSEPVSKPVVKAPPSSTVSQPNPSQQTKIPANYRFQQDFLFRWDGSQALSIPRKQLAGYHYFKSMLRKIENSFYPPGGGNFAYRDSRGYVVREGIVPGEVKVMFLLNDMGDVIDIKLVSSMGQKIVDTACLDSIRGQNFGAVPTEVKENGMTFGINFIFPEFLNYR